MGREYESEAGEPKGESEGAAQLCYYNGQPDFSGAGGGMSASENRMSNYRGQIIYDTGAPKSTTGGKDTGKDATNVIMSLANAGDLNDLPGHMDEVSPAATSHSRNRGNRGGSYSENSKVNAKRG